MLEACSAPRDKSAGVESRRCVAQAFYVSYNNSCLAVHRVDNGADITEVP